ncbi:SGNH/GDSL hydrolase family protein [Arthrobacter sp. M2012083]|uniref:SGNH/GDSL hydrolase family protein n=1 Tax=Arthrobacter sp. M2012083 TaxID=1197706 RepID=UPI0004748D6A|nr:SGNH/GDSL hydrolase family protein [Arthrobacter sp. M2012083]
MATHQVRRRHTAFVGGLAIVALCLGFTASPATAAPPAPVDYVALGDSYTAGTGAGGLYADAVCWRSVGGYVNVVAETGRVDLLANGACHGALLFPVLGVPIPSVSEQIGSLGSNLAAAELVSITAGANDIGSGDALVACLTQTLVVCQAAVNNAMSLLPALELSLAAIYDDIADAAPNATIAVMGYPRLFDPVNGVPIISVEHQNEVNRAVDALNRTIEAAVKASDANAVFVDVTKRFRGHAVNSAEPWIVLVPAPVPPFDRLPDANFHPNPAGHQAYAAALLSTIKPAQLAKQ